MITFTSVVSIFSQKKFEGNFLFLNVFCSTPSLQQLKFKLPSIVCSLKHV